MDQEIIDRAVAIATRQAMAGEPVAKLIYCSPQSATQREGYFIIVPYLNDSAAGTPPWGE